MPQNSHTRKPTVYLIAQPTVSRTKGTFDINRLYEHGDVVVLLPMGDSPTFKPEKCYDAMDKRFENFDPDIDYIVWAGGDTLAAVMIGMILVDLDIWEFNWLRYERARLADGSRTDEGARYTPVRINLRLEDTDEHQLKLLESES